MRFFLVGAGFGLGWAGLSGSGFGQPARGSIAVAGIILLYIAFRYGRRTASAVAVAQATAVASAQATAAARAEGGTAHGGAAQVAVQFVMNGQEHPTAYVRDTPVQVFTPPSRLVTPEEKKVRELSALDPDMDPGELLDSLMHDGEEAFVERAESGGS